MFSKEWIHNRICVLLAGRIAEELKFNEITSGAADDLEKVTELAYATILQFGMNEKIGNISYSESLQEGYLIS